MAIDMSTVKKIMYNNKEIAKIEDSLGNILWQSQSPGPSITYPYMFMSNNTYLYSKDYDVEWMWTSNSMGPVTNPQGQYYWSDGTNLYYSQALAGQYKYTGSLNNYDKTKWVACPSSWSILGNDIIKINGEIYALRDSNSSYKYNPNTDTWDRVTITGAANGMNGDTIWTDGIDIYWNTANNKIRVLDQTTLTWGSEITTTSTNASSYYYWTDGTDVYYSNGTTQKVWDKANRTWNNKTWTGLTNFNGNEVFYYNGKIYTRSQASGYPIYKLSNDTWTNTYTNPLGNTNFRGARMWDLGGRCTANTMPWLTGLRRANK